MLITPAGSFFSNLFLMSWDLFRFDKHISETRWFNYFKKPWVFRIESGTAKLSPSCNRCNSRAYSKYRELSCSSAISGIQTTQNCSRWIVSVCNSKICAVYHMWFCSSIFVEKTHVTGGMLSTSRKTQVIARCNSTWLTYGRFQVPCTLKGSKRASQKMYIYKDIQKFVLIW